MAFLLLNLLLTLGKLFFTLSELAVLLNLLRSGFLLRFFFGALFCNLAFTFSKLTLFLSYLLFSVGLLSFGSLCRNLLLTFGNLALSLSYAALSVRLVFN